MAVELPDRAQVVIIGGGVIGTSVAYHLTKLGLTDVVLLEQGQLSSGTTWHAAGLVGQLRASESQTRLVQYSTELYAELEAETGLSAGYKQCGGVTVARSEDRMIQLRRTAANAEKTGGNSARSTFMTISNEVLKISTSVSAADVAIPAGFKLSK